MNRELVNWLNQVAQGLPADVVRIEETNYNICVYWHERTRGSEQLVLEFLKDCASMPLLTADPEDTAQ